MKVCLNFIEDTNAIYFQSGKSVEVAWGCIQAVK